MLLGPFLESKLFGATLNNFGKFSATLNDLEEFGNFAGQFQSFSSNLGQLCAIWAVFLFLNNLGIISSNFGQVWGIFGCARHTLEVGNSCAFQLQRGHPAAVLQISFLSKATIQSKLKTCNQRAGVVDKPGHLLFHLRVPK